MPTRTDSRELEPDHQVDPDTQGPEVDPPDGKLAELAALAGRSGRVLQLRSLQAMVDASPRVTSRADIGAGEGALPANLRAGVERLSGVAMDGVTVHYDSREPAALRAHSFARGGEIHLAPGRQGDLPHEAWHIAQQRQGRVEATRSMDRGSGPSASALVNDDPGLEREADVMGERARQLGDQVGDAPAQEGLRASTPDAGDVVQRISVAEVESGFEYSSLTQKNLGDALDINDVYAKVAEVITAHDPEGKWTSGIQQALFNLTLEVGSWAEAQTIGYWEHVAHLALRAVDETHEVPKRAKAKAKPELQRNDYGSIASGYKKMVSKHQGSDDIPKQKERVVLEVAMGQGVVADLRKYMLYSGGFSSCTPVLMGNRHMGGLFHYAAGEARQMPKLLELARKVKPTWMAVGPHGGGGGDDVLDDEADDTDEFDDMYADVPMASAKPPSSAHELKQSRLEKQRATPDRKRIESALRRAYPKIKSQDIASYESVLLVYDKLNDTGRILDNQVVQAGRVVNLTQRLTKPKGLDRMDFSLFTVEDSMDTKQYPGEYAKLLAKQPKKPPKPKKKKKV